MSIIHNLQDINTVTIGSENIENIYLGEDLLWTAESSPYTPDQVIFESSTPGTYSVDILTTGKYEVICVGGGGGGVRWGNGNILAYQYAGGGSGGYSNLIQTLVKDNYTVIIGGGGGWTSNGANYAGTGGTSSFSDIVNATGGQGGKRSSTCSGGVGITQNGNGGTPSTAGASVYNGYGKGGYGASNGSAGYVKIVYKGK